MSTTDKNIWTADKIDKMDGYYALYKGVKYIGCINCSTPTIDDLVEELNAKETANAELLKALKSLDQTWVENLPHDHKDYKIVMQAREMIERYSKS